MEDPGVRKTPPDRALEEKANAGRLKKSKKEVKEDTIMSDKMMDADEYQEEDEACNGTETNALSKSQVLSYKDSLMGFKGTDYNGIAYGSSSMEEDPLMSDLMDQEWQIPEPSEEMKELMKIYPVMTITPEEYNKWSQPWNNALIITVLGAKINLYRLKEHLARIWRLNNFSLIDLPNNYFVVRFKDKENWGMHYKKVLFEGPWTIGQHTILVQRWSPYFDPFKNPLGRVAIWVRIPHIPLLCYTKECMWRLGDMIGKTLKVDMNTIANIEDREAHIERGRYARICVEVDLQKKLIPRIISASTLFNIEYEGLGLICFSCGRYGHRREHCPWRTDLRNMMQTQDSQKTANQVVAESPKASENILPAKDDMFGPWMLVRKPARAGNSMTGGKKDRVGKADGVDGTGWRKENRKTYTRFEPLEDTDEIGEDFMEIYRRVDDEEKKEEDNVPQETLTYAQKSVRKEWKRDQIYTSGNKNKQELMKAKGSDKKWAMALGKKNKKLVNVGGLSKEKQVNEDFKLMGQNSRSPIDIETKNKQNNKTQRQHRIVTGCVESVGPSTSTRKNQQANEGPLARKGENAATQGEVEMENMANTDSEQHISHMEEDQRRVTREETTRKDQDGLETGKVQDPERNQNRGTEHENRPPDL